MSKIVAFNLLPATIWDNQAADFEIDILQIANMNDFLFHKMCKQISRN